ncbi:MAG TPA: glutamine-synthetase adenylyltransferase, partial [Mizugakiibacter sp.]|nr:glutamine-synthetase adenylyltransferase [Mizugakiibacter sp.]
MSATPVDDGSLQGLLATRYDELVTRCRMAGVAYYDDAGVAERIQRLLLASDHAFAGLCAQPRLLAPEGLEWLLASADVGSRASSILLTGLDETAAMHRLRRFRQAEALRLLFRDVNGLDDIDDTLAQTTSLYEGLIESALVYAERRMAAQHGWLRNTDGQTQRLVVMALGKLGGGELNYSSDVDLVLAYAEQGRSDGPRPLQASEYYTRLGGMLVRLLDTVTAEGQVTRVDLRLRPFGQAGRVAVSFAAMETYYQREGRDWERYAWIKARPVAGDRRAGRHLLNMLRPFVYRRYLDYTAFDGLREMKTMIDLEVARRDRAEDLKLGPGGIREIEFMVQLEQLIRCG